MSSVLLMAVANIRKRKAQSLLISVSLLLAALLLAAAIGILEVIQDPVAQMFQEQQGSHLTLLQPHPQQDVDDIAHWWTARIEIAGVNKISYYMAEDNFSHNGKLQSMGGIMLSEHPGLTLQQDRLQIVTGEIKDSPGRDELWVPTGYAHTWDLRIGDTLEVPIQGELRSLQISAIVVDPQFSTPLMNPVRAWVGNGFFTSHEDESPPLRTMIGIRFHDYSQYDQIWQEFEAYLQTPFSGFIFEYDFILNAYNMVQSILGAVILAFSVIIIAVALSVIGFTIANTIMTDYRVIGILKAQGFSVADVRWIYVLQYLSLSLLVTPCGILASKYLVGAVTRQMSKSLGIAGLEPTLWLSGGITAATILVTVMLSALAATAKTTHIKPAAAIRNAAPATQPSGGRSFSISSHPAWPVTLLLAVKNTLAGKRHSGFIIISALVLAFVLSFSVNTFNSIKDMDKNFAYWGFDAAHVYLSPEENAQHHSHAQVHPILLADERVQAVLPNGVILNAAIPAQAGQSSKNIIGFMHRGDMDAIGIINLEGNNPQREDEVAISYMVAQKYGKAPGDMIDLFLEGQRATFVVTGIYQTMNAGGWGVKLQEAAVQKFNPEVYCGTYSVKLNDGQDTADFVNDMQTVFADRYSVRSVADSGEINISKLTGNIGLVTALLGLIFMAIAFVIIFNATLMEVYSEKRTLGIYSALGMTSLQIRSIMLWKALALSGCGVIAGTALALLVSPPLLGMLLRTLGMVKFPFAVTLLGTLAVLPVCLIVIAVSAWLPSRAIANVSPRDLVVE